MEVFHVGDKVYLDNIKYKYCTRIDIDTNDEDNDDCGEHFVALFSSSTPIKVILSDEGKKAYKYHFGVEPLVDANGRTEFTNLAQLIETCDPTFIYGDKYLLEDDKILVKAAD